MRNIQFIPLLLALLVIASFSATGIGIAMKNTTMIFATIILGFAIMGIGLRRKRKRMH